MPNQGEEDKIMLDISKLSVAEVLNNNIAVDNRGQNPRRVSSHICIDFFGIDPEESEKKFFEKLEKGQHPFQQKKNF